MIFHALPTQPSLSAPQYGAEQQSSVLAPHEITQLHAAQERQGAKKWQHLGLASDGSRASTGQPHASPTHSLLGIPKATVDFSFPARSPTHAQLNQSIDPPAVKPSPLFPSPLRHFLQQQETLSRLASARIHTRMMRRCHCISAAHAATSGAAFSQLFTGTCWACMHTLRQPQILRYAARLSFHRVLSPGRTKTMGTQVYYHRRCLEST